MTMRILIGLLLMIGTAHAATLTTSWTNATERTDGTAFPSSALANSTVEWGTCNGNAFGTMIGTSNANGAGTSLVSPTLPPAIYCVRVKHNATDGTMSAWSNIGIKSIVAAPPNPPVLTTVTQTAYEIQPSKWFGIRMVKVGSVDLGELCGQPLESAPRYGALTEDQVTLSNNSKWRGGQLYGRCG